VTVAAGVLFCLTILLVPSNAVSAGRARFKSPWYLTVVCDNDTIVNERISKDEFSIPETGTRWKCKVSALDPSTDGSSASRDLVCSTDERLSV